MGDFRKKFPRLISREKKSCNEIPGERIPALKKISLKAYNARKKNLAPFDVVEKISNSRGLGKKILTQTKSPPQKSNGRPLTQNCAQTLYDISLID